MIRLRLSCDGTWPVATGRVACSGALSVGMIDETAARLEALRHGWTSDREHGDLCPAHTRHKEQR